MSNITFMHLKEALRKRNISNKAYAEFLGVSEKTIQNKMNGETEFTLSEVTKTMKIIFPEYAMEYLFEPISREAETGRGA